MNQPTPLSKRSKSKSAGLKAIGWLLLVFGTICALAGIQIVMRAFFDVLERTDLALRLPLPYVVFFAFVSVLGVFIAQGGRALIRRGKKFAVASAEEVSGKDRRAPVLYIRSFREDRELLTVSDRGQLWTSAFFAPVTDVQSKEEALADCMSEIGPVIAIGNPREQLPELGAARMYFTNEEWQQRVLEKMEQARLVVLLGGPTKNLWWEVEQSLKKLRPEQLICIVLGSKDPGARAFIEEFENKIGRPGAITAHLALPKRGLLRIASLYGHVVYFDPGWAPKVAEIRRLTGKMAWYSQTVNQFEPALRVALRPVFARLGVAGPRLGLYWPAVIAAIIAVLVAVLVLVAWLAY